MVKDSHIYADGRGYTGQFENGLRNGHGTLILSNGLKYVGEFKDGNREGYGTLLTIKVLPFTR